VSEFEHQASEQTGFTEGAGGPGAMDPLGPGGPDAEAEMDLLGTDGLEKKRHSGMLVLILVVGLAIGGLFSMHTLTKVTASPDHNNEIEETIEEFLKALTGGSSTDPGDGGDPILDDHRAVLDVLNDDYTDLQVANVQRDPFDITGEVVTDTGDVGEWQREDRRAAMKEAATKLRVQSVLMGARPAAIINGRLVRLGQVIESSQSQGERGPKFEFRVTEISHGSVTLVAEDPKLDLRVETVLHLKRHN
jgi:hypothetical protein